MRQKSLRVTHIWFSFLGTQENYISMPREAEVICVTSRAKHFIANVNFPAHSIPAPVTMEVHVSNGAFTGWWEHHHPRPPSHPRKWPEFVGIFVSKKQTFLLLSHSDMRVVCYHSITYPILISITQSGIWRPIYPHINLSKQNTLDSYLVEKPWWPHSSLSKNISSSCSGTV